MLKHTFAAALFVCAAVPAHAKELGITHPERLTAGASDQLLGAMGPSGRLFYVDNEAGTYKIRVLDPQSGASGQLLDDAADATWPRPSKDGKHLLYISHRTAASGQLCLRDLDDAGKVSERRCLTAENEAVYEAEWTPDSKSVVAVVRPNATANYKLFKYDLGGSKQGELVSVSADVNPANPALSPDGRWVAYVPIARKNEAVPPNFAADATQRITVQRVAPDSKPVDLAFELPGRTGFPAFSADGKFLYFSQYLNDTNLDQNIDGNDNGVIFRVPFDTGNESAPIDPKKREQLTSAEWNCQYPEPSTDRLIATCLFEGSLHVYSLPLEGSVPSGWGPTKLDDEISAAQTRWEKLLLLSRRFDIDPIKDRPDAVLDVIELHLSLGELQSAEFYTHQLETMDAKNPAVSLAPFLRELITHRHKEVGLSRGELSEQFILDARERVAKVAGLESNAAPEAAVLGRLVRCEIHDTLGETEEATKLLKSVELADLKEPFLLNMAADRAASLYRDLETREPLLDVYRKLSAAQALPVEKRLEYADRFVDWLFKGRPTTQFASLLETASTTVPPDTDLGFRLDLERRLLGLDAATQETVRGKVFELYKANKTFERRQALVNTTIRRAAKADNDYLLYQFADTWVSYVDQKRAARRPAENLYRQVVLERAYIERARGDVGDARSDFFGVTLQTDALEAHLGFIEQRFKEGKTEADILKEYETRFGKTPNDPVFNFARAWLVVRALPVGDADKFAKQADLARGYLRVAAPSMWARFELQQLWGYLEHQAFRVTDERQNAVEATSHYKLALDLARETPRARAAVLEDLAQLQASVGNHAIALQYFEERDKLPWIDPVAELQHRLGKARSLLHLERGKSACREIDTAVSLQASKPELTKFRALVLDRAALYHLDSAEFDPAFALYDQLIPVLQKSSDPIDQGTNLRKARLGRAAAEVGVHKAKEALADLDAVTAAAVPTDQARYVSPREGSIITGLRARAYAELQQWDDALKAMEVRRAELEAAFKRDELDQDLLDLSLAEAQMAEWSWQKKDSAATLQHLQAAFTRFDAWSESSGTPVHLLGLQILDTAARLHLDAGLSLATTKIDLATRLKAAQNQLSTLRNPDWVPMRDRFTTYLTRLASENVN